MEKLNEIKMDKFDENNGDLLLNDTHNCKQIMPQGTLRPNIISNEINADGDRELENILSRVPVHDVFQYKAIISQLLNELDQIDRTSNQFETKFYEESSSNISNEKNMFKENQGCPQHLNSSSALVLSISKVDYDTYPTKNDIQKRHVLHDIDGYNIPTTNLNSIIQPSHPFSCKTCNNKYTERCSIKRHLEVHIREKQFFCSECNKQLAEKEYLKHMLDHSKEKAFLCGICNKQLSGKKSLGRHMLTHTAEKPFLCGTCNKRFIQKQYLDDHQMTHTGHIPHKCHLCEKKFGHKSNLSRHLRTHKNVTS